MPVFYIDIECVPRKIWREHPFIHTDISTLLLGLEFLVRKQREPLIRFRNLQGECKLTAHHIHIASAHGHQAQPVKWSWLNHRIG